MAYEKKTIFSVNTFSPIHVSKYFNTTSTSII
jgi:hypothetical protein